MGDGIRVVGLFAGPLLKLLAYILGQVFLPSLIDRLIRLLLFSLTGYTLSHQKLKNDGKDDASKAPRFLIHVRSIGSYFTPGVDHGGNFKWADRLK